MSQSLPYDAVACGELYEAIMERKEFQLTHNGETRPKRRVYCNDEVLPVLGDLDGVDAEDLLRLSDEIAFEFIDSATQGEEEDGMTLSLGELLQAERQTATTWLVPYGEKIKVLLTFEERQG